MDGIGVEEEFEYRPFEDAALEDSLPEGEDVSLTSGGGSLSLSESAIRVTFATTMQHETRNQ